MRIPRSVKWSVATVAVLLGVTAATGYLLAKRAPSDYRPLTPSRVETARAVDSLRKTVVEFLGVAGRIGSRDPNAAPRTQPRRRKFVVRQENLNQWIASLPTDVLHSLYSAGLSRPAIALDDDRFTFYVYWETMNVVVGLDFAFEFAPDDSLVIRVKSVRLGGLVLPETIVAGNKHHVVDQLRIELLGLIGGDSDQFGPLKVDEVSHTGAQLIDALDGRPIRLDISKRYGHARVRGITITKGQMVLDVVSLLNDEA